MVPRPPRWPLLYHPATAWVVLALSLVFTVLAWSISADAIRAGALQRFRFQTQDIASAIAGRLLTYETILRAGAGLFNASDTVTRGEWRQFVADLQLQQNFPGIQGLGFSLMVTPQGLARHLAEIRAEGFPDYAIRPAGERDTYSSILYLEPFDWRNRRAFGYDMYAEPVRRQAMERARDTGAPTISGRVTLVQETTQDMQYGFLMYMPVYRKGLPTTSGDERRAALLGFVYSPFRAKDFMTGLLGVAQGGIEFALYDGAAPSTATLLYDNLAGGALAALRPAPPDAFTALVPVQAGQRTWGLQVRTLPGYLSGTQQAQPLIVAVGGLIIALCLFYIIVSSRRRQRLAEGRSDQLAGQLTQSEQRYNALFASANEPILLSDPQTGAILEANPAAQRFYGYDEGHLRQLRICDLHQASPRQDADAAPRAPGQPRDDGCFTRRLATGEVRQVEVDSGDLAYQGRPARYCIIHDVTERRQAAAALQAALDFQTQLLEAIPTPVFYKDTDGRYQNVNRPFIELFGGTKAELIGRTVYDSWPRETADIFFARDQALFQNPGQQVYETQILNQRGERRDVVFHKATLHFPDGRLRGLIGFVLDITESKAATAALQRSEQRFRTLFTASRVVMLLIDPATGAIVDANAAAGHYYGFTVEELRQMKISAINTLTAEQIAAQMQQATAQQRWLFHFRHRRADGAVRDVEVHSGPLELDGRPLLYSIIHDITEQRAAEAALQAREERLQLVLEGANDGFWDWDLTSGAVLFSPRWARMLGYELAEVQPHIRIWRRLMHPADHRRARAALLAHFAGETPRFEIEHRMLTKHGDWRWFLQRGKVTARDAAGRPLRMAGTHTDITERRGMEEALRIGLAAAQRHDRQIVGLNRMSELLLSCETRTEAYTVIARSAARLFVGLGGALAVPGEAAGPDLRVVASWGEPGALPTTFPAGHCWALRRGAIHEVNELTPGTRCRHLSDPPPPAHLCLPLTVRGDTLGLLHLCARAALTAAEFADLRTLAVAFSEAAKLALSNIRLQETLREQAIRDPLTGLFNRRYLDETLPRELQLSRRRGEPLAAAMLDLDHFKRFNDAYGHEAGDAVLRAVGALLAGSLRGGDVACRYGGEELTLILPGATLEAARGRLEGLRQALMQTRVLYHGGDLPAITVSIGVTVAGAQETDAAAVLARADAALFRAKESGRNRVVAVAP